MKRQRPKYTFPPGTTILQIMDWIRNEDIRSKGDLRGWTGSPPMHLNKEPVEPVNKEPIKPDKKKHNE
jgi:hypothetical protein